MVLDYYKLREQPFGVTPDPRFLFLSRTHREAMASLLYGIDAGCGFLALIAAPGLGKTTLLFRVMHQLQEKARTILFSQTVSTPMELLGGLMTGLGVRDTRGSMVELQLQLKEELIGQARQGKRVVLALDEAQNLPGQVLEMLRMLSNFETPREKLIQIILAGQTELASRMAMPGLQQLRQRITIYSYLKPLSHEDAELYIAHRLRTAGYDFESPLFSREALAMIADCSNGVPRNINNLCFNALSLGCALKRCPIDSAVLGEVFNDLDSRRQRQKPMLTGQLVPAGASWKGPAFALARKGNARLAGWRQRFALVLAALLLSTALYFAAHRQLTQKAGAVHAQSFAPAASTSSLPLAGEPPPPPTDGTKTVTARPGETLFAICLATFGRCDADLLQNLRRLNSGLINPDHIEVGQQIRIPTWDAGLEQRSDAQEDTP
jgi:general secretion pathway protein A